MRYTTACNQSQEVQRKKCHQIKVCIHASPIDWCQATGLLPSSADPNDAGATPVAAQSLQVFYTLP
jgi:hypothetical protein